MNRRMVGYLLGTILLIEAVLLIVPMLTALIYGESVLPFVFTILLLLLFAFPAKLLKPKDKRIYAKEGFVCVGAAWLLMSAFGALPFVFSGAIPNYINALFETVSGFTTTGSTILTEIESLPKGILFWRSFTHWIGGMGVLVFMMAILPSVGGQAIHLLRAETTGPTKGKLVPKLRNTAMILYGLYFALTVLQAILLLIAKMPLYDAITTALATAGTGGFSVRNSSFADYNAACQWITAVFMLIFGVNFNMYFLLLMRRLKTVFRNAELRVYLLIAGISTALIAANTFRLFSNAEECLRAAFFQVTTIMSTSGFATTNYDLWPDLSKTILVVLMVIGGCAGSTAGGLKVSRVMLVIKNMAREVRRIIRPRSVNVVKQDGEAIPLDTLHHVSNYISIYVFIIIVTTLLLSIDGFGLETNLTATLACVNNIGPGLSMVGPVGNFAAYSWFSKLLLTLDMLIGRLEILPMLIFFSPAVWNLRNLRKRKEENVDALN